MTVRELMVVLDGTAMVKVIEDGYGSIYTGCADRAPLALLGDYDVAKIYTNRTIVTVLCVEATHEA